jgi:hypothetical protein
MAARKAGVLLGVGEVRGRCWTGQDRNDACLCRLLRFVLSWWTRLVMLYTAHARLAWDQIEVGTR